MDTLKNICDLGDVNKMQKEREIYRLPVIISIDTIYKDILPNLSKKYRNLGKGEQTEVSLIQTDRIDSNAIPTFVGILNILKNKSGLPVYLELVYNVRLLCFLDSIGFFRILSELEIIVYDKNYIGGFDGYNFNNNHKIYSCFPILDYENKPVKEKMYIRDVLSERLKYEVMSKYIALVRKKHKLSDGDEYLLLTAISEIILNAQIYSTSMCYTYMQSGIKVSNKKKKILLSIVDIGKGFKNSLDNKIKTGEYNKEDREKFHSYINELKIDFIRERHFISIMEALYYSELQPRKMNLYNLKKLLANSHANFRIFYKNRQVVFTSDRCYSCKDKKIFNCIHCLWKAKQNSKTMQQSPIKEYPLALAGVHIDIEFIMEESNV